MEAGDSFTAAAAVLRSDKQKEAVSKAKRLKKYQGNGSVLVSSSASIALMSIQVPLRAMTQ
ncbi:hypothetical protein SAMN05421736_101429 [Evansella caseinilytica]|uniref:Uncharacterized protein n=1 Tax=Evansella caseinilytica TaxID=1503961 RepID=A0A1H3HBW2_9BACI|nr:hypothetical protein [Evansella caseinilytica]SDY12274.1 hypothetical protein SAMN05421736_101429 [Evansella caseinilytica]